MNILKDGSMLSNISNISVLIKPGDGSSIFNFPNLHEIDNGQSIKPCEVKIQDLFPQQPYYPSNSLFDKMMKKQEKQGSSINFLHTPILPHVTYHNTFNQKSWRITQQKGVSEDQCSKQESPKQQIEEEQQRKIKNQTKNIPKNYGKAIISFIQKYKQVVQEVCEYTDVPFDDFFRQMVEEKKTINTIADLRRLWIDYKYARCMRILSNLFFRKYSLNYIFNSRICNFKSHIKYRHRLWQAIKNPHAFRHIKDY